MKKALFFLLLLLSACFPKKERPLFEACFYFEELPKIMGQILEEPKGLKGNFSLRISNEKGSFVIRGKFLYQEKEGLWALGLDPWGSELFQVWIRDEDLFLFIRRKRCFSSVSLKGVKSASWLKRAFQSFPKFYRAN